MVVEVKSFVRRMGTPYCVRRDALREQLNVARDEQHRMMRVSNSRSKQARRSSDSICST